MYSSSVQRMCYFLSNDSCPRPSFRLRISVMVLFNYNVIILVGCYLCLLEVVSTIMIFACISSQLPFSDKRLPLFATDQRPWRRNSVKYINPWTVKSIASTHSSSKASPSTASIEREPCLQIKPHSKPLLMCSMFYLYFHSWYLTHLLGLQFIHQYHEAFASTFQYSRWKVLKVLHASPS